MINEGMRMSYRRNESGKSNKWENERVINGRMRERVINGRMR